MSRFFTLLLAVLTLCPRVGLAQTNVATQPDSIPAGAATPGFLSAGGSYAASAMGSADINHEAVPSGGPVGQPNVYMHFEAGAWANGGKEPAAFAHADVHFAAGPGSQYLYRPPPSGSMSYAGYRVECNPDEDNHCDCSIPTNCTFHTNSSASVVRRYRIKNVTTSSLPPGQTFVPLLVDYAHHRRVNTLQPLPSPQTILSVSSSVLVRYRDGATIVQSREAFCSVDTCASGATLTGTLELPVYLDYLEAVEMRLSVNIFVNNNPTCIDMSFGEDEVCVVPPYQGSAQALVDPFTYVDPSWEYADWFEVEVSDDDGETWHPVERTEFDLVAFGVEDGANPLPDGGVPDGGTPDAGTPDGGVPDAGDPDAGNPAGGNDGGGGGCATSPTRHNPARSPWALAIMLSLVVLGARRAARI